MSKEELIDFLDEAGLYDTLTTEELNQLEKLR